MRLSTEQQASGTARPGSTPNGPAESVQPSGVTTAAAASAASQSQANLAASQPEAHGFQPWQSRLQTPSPSNAMAGFTDQRDRTIQMGSGRPLSRISPKPGPVELRPLKSGQAQCLQAGQQSLTASAAFQGLAADGTSGGEPELSQQGGSENDEDEEELRKVSRCTRRFQSIAKVLSECMRDFKALQNVTVQ